MIFALPDPSHQKRRDNKIWEESMSEPKKRFESKKERYSTSRLDTNVLSEFDHVVADFSNIGALLDFIESGSLDKVLTNWSILSNANNHSEFVDLSVKMAKATFMINLATGVDSLEDVKVGSGYEYRLLESRSVILAFYKNLISNHSKVIYRCLNSFKPSSTNPVLKTLINSIKYDSSNATEIFNEFDLSMPNLPKLLVPTRMDSSEGAKRTTEREIVSIRANFLRFWMVWLANLSSLVRKDVMLKHYKIMGNIWKYMFEVDSIELLSEIFAFIKDSILLESNFKKLTKCLILNEHFFQRVQPIFLRLLNLTSHPFIELFNLVMNIIISDTKNGLIYPTPKLWQKTKNGQEVGSHHEIELNNLSYKINNKSLYTLVTSMRPFESFNQLEFVERLLQNCPELIPVYMQWTIQNGGGYHEPSLTSWWMSHTLLYSKIILLPLPDELTTITDFVSQNIELDMKLISESIYLAPLTKSALNKCLETNKPIITQLSLQLISQICLKTKEFMKVPAISHKQELVELVFNHLPDFTNIISVYTKNEDSNGKNSKLIKFTSLQIINLYCELFPKMSPNTISQITTITNNGLSQLIDGGLNKSTKFDLTLLNEYLSIHSNMKHDQLKWWVGSKGGHSLFSSLIKLGSASLRSIDSGSIDESFVWKTANLLAGLVDSKLLFDKGLLITPVLALIYSFDCSDQDLPSVWNLLDEVIGRVVRSPYKYIDLSHKNYNDVSIFIVALIEQFNFVLEKNANASNETKWLFNCLKYLIVVGEDKLAIIKMLNDFLGKLEAFNAIVSSESLFDVLEFKDQTLVVDDRNNSFFTKVVNTSNLNFVKNFKEIEKKPLITKLDLAALIFKIELLINDKEFIKHKRFEEIIVLVFSKLGNFVLSTSDENTFRYLGSSKFWSRFLVLDKESVLPNDKKFLVFGILNEILLQIPLPVTRSTELHDFIYRTFQDDSLTSFQEVLIGEYNWILTDTQVAYILNESGVQSNSTLTLKLMQSSVNNNIKVKPLVFFGVLVNLSVGKDLEDQKRMLLSQMLEKGCLDDEGKIEIDSEVSSILQDESKLYLLDYLFKSPYKQSLIEYVNDKVEHLIANEKLMFAVAYAISTNLVDIESYAGLIKFLTMVTQHAVKAISEVGNTYKWNELLVILANGIQSIEDDSMLVEQIFNYVDSNNAKVSMIPEFASFVLILVKSKLKVDDRVKTWVHKAMLYITKKFAESNNLSASFNRFLDSFCELTKLLYQINSSIWELVPASIVNTQLEVILRHAEWILEPRYLEYLISIVITSNKKLIAYEKAIQILVSNKNISLNSLPNKDNSRIRFLSATLLASLFAFNPAKNSTELLQDKLILFYLGTTRAEDVIIKSVLVKIEAQIAKLWVIKVNNWAFTDEMSNEEIELVGEDRLILEDKSGFNVVLNKNFVRNTIENYSRSSNMVEVPEQLSTLSGLPESFFETLEAFYDSNCMNVDREYRKSSYDVEFFILVILNSEELLKFVSPVSDVKDDSRGPMPIFNTKNLIDSNILQLLVINLSNENTRIVEITKIILQGVLNSLGEEAGGFQDKGLFRVYVANILNTLKNHNDDIPPLVWYIYSRFIPILSNPSHFLYEKCFRFVLANTSLYPKEIPLYQSIVFSVKGETDSDDDTYYRQVNWLVDGFILGSKTEKDIHLLQIRGAFEWILNLLNSPFASMKLRTQVYKLLFQIQSIDQGSDLLISRFGILANMEQNLHGLETSLRSPILNSDLFDEQLKLNLKEVVLRLGFSSCASKRLREWTGGDLPQYVKRIA